MSTKQDYYKILELTDDDKKLSGEEFKKKIKSNYRSLSKKYHPDKNPNNKEAEEKFKEISSAYDTLSDDDKRSKYNQFGDGYNTQRQQSRYRYQQQTRTGESMNLLVKLTLEEIHTGVKKTYKYNRNDKCGSCDGHGGKNSQDCSTCGGQGVIARVINTPIGQMQQIFPCHVCNGVGITYTDKCTSCNGNGVKSVQETIDINIPSGAQEGMTFVLHGKGNAVKSGNNGDLHVNIMELKHNTYTRNGSDLKLNLKLTYKQLVLGDKVEIETIDGSKIRITIPEYSDVGDNLKVSSKGLNVYGKDARGDVVITLGISIPKEINDETRELLLKLN